MPRGPPPAVAIAEAIKNAAIRGATMDRDLLRESRLVFVLFAPLLTIFVQVRRSRHHLMSPEDCAREYRADIFRLRRIPLTGVAAREIWLLTPWDTWQYFRILDDRVIEIRADGTPMVQKAGPAPVGVPGAAPTGKTTAAGGDI
jgi:hypothetical protein